MATFLDKLLGDFRWYRSARGGKWESLGPCCDCPFDVWRRVPLFRPMHWPVVRAREDHR